MTSIELVNLPKLTHLEASCCGLTNINVVNCLSINTFNVNRCQLIEVKIDNLPSIVLFNAANNLLTSVDFLTDFNSENLTHLSIHGNNFARQDLFFLSKFTNLEKLFLDNHDEEKFKADKYNRFFGSLQPLQNLTNLKWLNIANTDLDSGLEYLPESLRKICLINNWERKGVGYIKIKEELEKCSHLPEVTKNYSKKKKMSQNLLKIGIALLLGINTFKIY